MPALINSSSSISQVPFKCGKSPSKSNRELARLPTGYQSRIKAVAGGRHCHCDGVEYHADGRFTHGHCHNQRELLKAYRHQDDRFVSPFQDFVNTPLAAILAGFSGWRGNAEQDNVETIDISADIEGDNSYRVPSLDRSTVTAADIKSEEDTSVHFNLSDSSPEKSPCCDCPCVKAYVGTRQSAKESVSIPMTHDSKQNDDFYVEDDNDMITFYQRMATRDPRMAKIAAGHKLMEIKAHIQAMKKQHCQCNHLSKFRADTKVLNRKNESLTQTKKAGKKGTHGCKSSYDPPPSIYHVRDQSHLRQYLPELSRLEFNRDMRRAMDVYRV